MGSWTGEMPLSLGDRDRESPARGRAWLETGWAGPVPFPFPSLPVPMWNQRADLGRRERSDVFPAPSLALCWLGAASPQAVNEMSLGGSGGQEPRSLPCRSWQAMWVGTQGMGHEACMKGVSGKQG